MVWSQQEWKSRGEEEVEDEDEKEGEDEEVCEEMEMGMGGRDGAREGRRGQPSLLDSAKRLHLEGVSMGSPFPVVFIFASMAITLQDILVATEARILVANPAKIR